MDVEELRRSQKKIKKTPNLPLVSVTAASVSGSQDSDDDDDEVCKSLIFLEYILGCKYGV